VATQALLDQSGAASLSVALVADGHVAWQQGFGYADKATQTAPGPDTMYGIGSVSRMLATVATMQLVDQGLVSLDQPVARYVPELSSLSPSYGQITVRMLLDHSSGLPGTVYDSLQVVDASRSDTTAEMFLRIPGFGSRDMWDLTSVAGGGDDLFRYGGAVYRPMATAPALAGGANSVAYASATEAAWVKVPAVATVTVSAGAAWRLFSSGVDFVDGGFTLPATLRAPAGAYLALFGAAGASATVTVVPD